MVGRVGIAENDFGDLRKALAQHPLVQLGGRAERVEIDLLEKAAIRFRPFGARIARVPEAFVVGGPGEAAAAGRILHARDRLEFFLAGCGVEHMQRADLAAVLRQRDGDQLAVMARPVPIHCGMPARIELVRIQHDLFLVRIQVGPQRHQARLLAARVEAQREDPVAGRHETDMARAVGAGQGIELRPDRGAGGQPVQIGPRPAVFRGGPGRDLRIGGILEPAIGIGDGDAMIAVADHCDLGRRRALVGGDSGTGEGNKGQEQGGDGDRSHHVFLNFVAGGSTMPSMPEDPKESGPEIALRPARFRFGRETKLT